MDEQDIVELTEDVVVAISEDRSNVSEAFRIRSQTNVQFVASGSADITPPARLQILLKNVSTGVSKEIAYSQLARRGQISARAEATMSLPPGDYQFTAQFVGNVAGSVGIKGYAKLSVAEVGSFCWSVGEEMTVTSISSPQRLGARANYISGGKMRKVKIQCCDNITGNVILETDWAVTDTASDTVASASTALTPFDAVPGVEYRFIAKVDNYAGNGHECQLRIF